MYVYGTVQSVQYLFYFILVVVDVTALYKWAEVSDPPIIKLNDEWDEPALYYTLPSILEIWQSSSIHYLREARAVLNLFKNRCFSFPASWVPEDADTGKSRKPFINIEGNTNKLRDFVAREVTEAIQGEFLVNPPTCLVPLKSVYGDPSNRLHYPYLSLGMYASSHAVKVHWGNKPVVMTGYWNDATATAMADIFINLTIPHKSSTLFEFPKDLLKPDLTVFLNCLNHAPDSREETRPPSWRNKFNEAFLKFRKIKLHEIIWLGADNATGSILDLIQEKLGEKFELSLK